MGEFDDRVAGLSPARQELLARMLAESGQDRAVGAAYAAPGTPVEQEMVEIWRDVLDVDPIGVDDDYFELGGDSVHAIVIVARAQQAGWQLSTQDIFDARTVRLLAARVGRTVPGPSTEPGAPPDPGPAEHPLTPLQQGILYHSAGGSTPGAYLVQLSTRLSGELDETAFVDAWTGVFAATPALRTVLRWADRAAASQLFVPGMALPITTKDHTALTAAERTDAFDRLLEVDRDRGFDLETGPLMRLTMVREAADEWRCLWTFHHIILDGWAQQLVLRDVFDRYTRLRAGQPAPARARPAFVEYLAWLAEQPPVDESFWRRWLGAAGVTRVAGPGCVDGQVQTAVRPHVERMLPKPVSAGVEELSRRHAVTASTQIHAAWAMLLAARSGGDHALFGSSLSGRPPQVPGVTECVGMFVNTLPLRVSCGGTAPVLDWLRVVQHDLAELRVRQHTSLSAVERAVGLTYGSGLFDSIVVVENFPTWLRDGGDIAGLRVDDVSVTVEEGYPLVLEFTPGTATLRGRYDPTRLDRAAVAAILDALCDLLGGFAREPELPLNLLRSRVDATIRRHEEATRAAVAARTSATLGAARRRIVGESGQA
ncbi:condensation domain-containing protein [Micromonospora lutea]|uniref:Carrier domain-containing protein n=1 Tax=Micromonospora lutea TaxID=419825 RepID=A0ABQ4IT26_9ACTN|nr:condensation domain-containing protein [Micromonospora lutea]GIJ21059.1 hypothetical protein Vlu01_16830 [Micromonospora lutea]